MDAQAIGRQSILPLNVIGNGIERGRALRPVFAHTLTPTKPFDFFPCQLANPVSVLELSEFSHASTPFFSDTSAALPHHSYSTTGVSPSDVPSRAIWDNGHLARCNLGRRASRPSRDSAVVALPEAPPSRPSPQPASARPPVLRSFSEGESAAAPCSTCTRQMGSWTRITVEHTFESNRFFRHPLLRSKTAFGVLPINCIIKPYA